MCRKQKGLSLYLFNVILRMRNLIKPPTIGQEEYLTKQLQYTVDSPCKICVSNHAKMSDNRKSSEA